MNENKQNFHKLYRGIAAVVLFFAAQFALATGYVPLITEIMMAFEAKKNPEPILMAIVPINWIKSDEPVLAPLAAGQDADGETLYLCSTRPLDHNLNNTKLGFTKNIGDPCYIYYSGDTDAKAEMKSDITYYFSTLSNQVGLGYQFNWSVPLKKRKEGHNLLAAFNAKNLTDFLELCRVSADGRLYPGFVTKQKSEKEVAKGKSICQYKKNLEDQVFHEALSSEVLYFDNMPEAENKKIASRIYPMRPIKNPATSSYPEMKWYLLRLEGNGYFKPMGIAQDGAVACAKESKGGCMVYSSFRNAKNIDWTKLEPKFCNTNFAYSKGNSCYDGKKLLIQSID